MVPGTCLSCTVRQGTGYIDYTIVTLFTLETEKFKTKMDKYGCICHHRLVGGDDKNWCPNDEANNSKTRTERARQHDPSDSCRCALTLLVET